MDIRRRLETLDSGHMDMWTRGHLDIWTRGHLDIWTCNGADRGHLMWTRGSIVYDLLQNPPTLYLLCIYKEQESIVWCLYSVHDSPVQYSTLKYSLTEYSTSEDSPVSQLQRPGCRLWV